jgi:hypothetical protein
MYVCLPGPPPPPPPRPSPPLPLVCPRSCGGESRQNLGPQRQRRGGVHDVWCVTLFPFVSF